jgi:hypothetical protein
MKSATISQLQKELKELPPEQVLEICVQLAKYKKENKEYLNFLIFGAQDKESYFEKVKEDLELQFDGINRMSAYTTKKGLQKMVRLLTKHIRQAKSQKTELELRLWFCNRIRRARINLDRSQVTSNLYYREVEKIKKVYGKLHEDMRYDYRKDLENLNISIDTY